MPAGSLTKGGVIALSLVIDSLFFRVESRETPVAAFEKALPVPGKVDSGGTRI
jgi:hypothetical protein